MKADGCTNITIGAACSDLKDAQGMMTPAMLIMMLPWMTWFAMRRPMRSRSPVPRQRGQAGAPRAARGVGARP